MHSLKIDFLSYPTFAGELGGIYPHLIHNIRSYSLILLNGFPSFWDFYHCTPAVYAPTFVRSILHTVTGGGIKIYFASSISFGLLFSKLIYYFLFFTCVECQTNFSFEAPSHHHHHHHHHVVPPAWISLILSRHFSLSFITSGRSSRLHPVSSLSCCM